MKAPNIFIVDNSYGVTGALNAIVNTCDQLRDVYSFTFIIPKRSVADQYLKERHYPVFKLPMVELSKRPFDLVMYLPRLLHNGWRLGGQIRKHDAAVVHVNDIYNLVGIVAATFVKFKLITHVRSLPGSYPKLLWRIWLYLHSIYSDKIIGVSKVVVSHLPKRKSLLIYDTIVLKELYPPKEVQEKNEIDLLYLSNFTEGKGQNFAIEAFNLAFKQDNKLRLKLVGGLLGMNKNRRFKSQLQESVQSLGLDHVVSFDGFTQDIERVMKESDILLNFSESESLSFVCIEALALGVPVICSINGGPTEYIKDGVNGLLVENRNVLEMEKSIIKLSSDIHLRRKFSENGKNTIATFFTKSNTWELLNSVYREFTYLNWRK